MGEALLMNHKRKKKTEVLKYYDTLTTIGATETIDGAVYNEAGYFGTVPASELFTATELASVVGITQGAVQHDDTPWLKFYLDGKIIFRPMKAIRNKIAWSNIDVANCVYGDKIVAKNGISFKVRLMKGSLVNPAITVNDTTNTTHYSEWNRLILPIHEYATKKTWSHPNFVEHDIPDWGVGFTNNDLNTLSGSSGSAIWCQESIELNSDNRVQRGSLGQSYATGALYTYGIATAGWCPVLEVVPPEELEGGI